MRSTRAYRGSLLSTVASGLVAGVIATIAKGQAESLLQPVAERVWPASPEDKRVPGANPAEHPEKMPPSEIASGAVKAVADDQPDDDTVATAAAGLHWGMGLGSAVAYAILSSRSPSLGRPRRTSWAIPLFGHARVVATSDRSATGAVEDAPRDCGWEAASHVVYGVAPRTRATHRGLRQPPVIAPAVAEPHALNYPLLPARPAMRLMVAARMTAPKR